MNLKRASITLMLFILCLQPLLGQNGFTNKDKAKNKTDANGLKQGKWIEYLNSHLENTTRDNAVLYKLSVYKDDKVSETVNSFFYPSGKLKGEMPFKDGKTNGIIKQYYESGKLFYERAEVDGKKNGIEKVYFETGALKQEALFTDGKKTGAVKTYYESGKLKEENPYINDIANGIAKSYFESGKLSGEVPITGGTINGICKYYFENGKLKQESPYTDGWMNGTSKEYDENGKLTSETSYTNGQKKATKEEEQEAILTYQLAQEEFDKANFAKAAQYLDKVEKLNPEAKIKASYLIAKCYSNMLPKSFARWDEQAKTIHSHYINRDCPGQNGAVTYDELLHNMYKVGKPDHKSNTWEICSRTYGNLTFDFSAYLMCMENIAYYLPNGNDETKKTEMLKLKIQIENTDEYNLAETTTIYNQGYEAEQKGDFLQAKKYYENSRDFCKFKPLYFNPFLPENKKDACCFFPNFDLDYAIDTMNKKIKESGK